LPREHLALVIEIPLRGNVVEIERASAGLIGEGGAMADDDHETPGPQRLGDFSIISGSGRR
jgi:hypothetical protein